MVVKILSSLRSVEKNERSIIAKNIASADLSWTKLIFDDIRREWTADGLVLLFIDCVPMSNR